VLYFMLAMLKPLFDDLFAYEDDLRLPGGLYLPSRATVLVTPSERVFVFSPLRFDDESAAAIDRLGEVSAVVAPSCIHYLFLEEAARRWPRARVLGPVGLEKKVPGQPFEPLPDRGEPEALGGELSVRHIEGVPYIGEHVFLHPRSRTLLVTDLVFNVHRCRGFGMQLFLRIVGAWRRTAQSRMWRFLTKDREAAARSVEDVLSWDFDRLVMAHGDPVDGGAREQVASALAWISAGTRPRLPPAGER
jgi:hypothetical protein